MEQGICVTFLNNLLSRDMFRSSRPKVFCKAGVLKNFAKFTEKHLWQSLFFKKVAGLRPAALLKKRLWHRCFPVNFRKFLRTPFLQVTSRRLLLYILTESDGFRYISFYLQLKRYHIISKKCKSHKSISWICHFLVKLVLKSPNSQSNLWNIQADSET